MSSGKDQPITDRCAKCKLELPPGEPGQPTEPCPACGSTARVVEGRPLPMDLGPQISTAGGAERNVNEARMATFTLIFATAWAFGLSIGLATSSWVIGPIAGVSAAVATTLMLASIHRVRFIRHAVMEFMHRVTGR